MSNDVNALMEMGFPKNRAERALSKTGYRGVQLAMDWCFAHEDDPDIDDPFEAPKGHVLGEASAETTEQPEAAGMEPTPAADNNAEGDQSAATQDAKSLKCEDCGKVLRNVEEAEVHAARTKHANFSESTEEKKALSEEERKEQMAKLQDKMKQKRLEKEEQEKKEALQREKMRRVHGRDLVAAKSKIEEQEMKKLVEQRRKEKEDDRLARQRVKEQIEKDKKDRALKFGKGAQGGESSQAAPAAVPAPAPAPAQPAEKKTYDEARIQIRLTNGTAITQTFGVKEPLAAVRLYTEMNRTDGDSPFTFMTTFPRKVFSDEDMEKPLQQLGLVPSAVLIVSKK